MALYDIMPLLNLMCDETSSVDVGANWIEPDQVHVAFRFNEDDAEDIEFHMLMTADTLRLFRDFLSSKLAEQPRDTE